MPASEDRAEHVSLLRWQLDPASARTARVTKQSPVPVTAFLTCAALFFTACVGVLVVGARPAVPGEVLPLSSLQSRRDASAAGERALMESLRFDERWYDQGNTLMRSRSTTRARGRARRRRRISPRSPGSRRGAARRSGSTSARSPSVSTGPRRRCGTSRWWWSGTPPIKRRRAAVAEQPAAARPAGGDVRGGHVVARRRGQDDGPEGGAGNPAGAGRGTRARGTRSITRSIEPRADRGGARAKTNAIR